MRKAVGEQFFDFTIEFEADLDCLHLDVDGLVTIGPGLLVDPIALLAGIDFYWPSSGQRATAADVADAWNAVHHAQDLREEGGGHFAGLTVIRATRESLARVATARLARAESDLRRFFPGWERFPAPGQLLILSMAWAMGAGAFSRWPHFRAAVNAGDWAAVAAPRGVPASCQMDEARQNASFRLRNAADLELAKAAAFAVDHGLEDELDVAGVLARAKAALAAR